MRYNPPSTIDHPKSAWIIIVGLCVLGLWHAPVEAANYYVATNGSNSNSGTSLANPFLTIQQAANFAQAGDTVYVRGGTYRETVTAARSGNPGAPITFQPYQNEQVTITGLNTLGGGWSTYSGSTYQNTVAGGVSQLFVNGQMMTEARSANSGYNNPLRQAMNTVDSASINTPPTDSTITSASLGTPGDGTWTGAKLAVFGGTGMVVWEHAIKGQTGNTVSFSWPTTDSAYAPTAGNRFYLYGSLAAVDSPKEYYYNGSTLYFNSAVNPNTQTVEVRKRSLGFDLGSQSYINVSGFQLKAANINVAGSHNQINNCQILYPTPFVDDDSWSTTSGVTIGGQNNTLKNSEIAYSWGSGVTVTGSSNTVSNNVVHDVNWRGNDSSGVDISGTSNSMVSNNTIYNAGRSGLLNRYATGATITNNEIARYGYITHDLGGTYCYQTDGGGTVIAYNKIHDCYDTTTCGVGVYLDNGSSNFTVHHNVVANAIYGAILNPSSTNENFYNNTLWGITSKAMLGSSLTNCKTYNNLSNMSGWVGTDQKTNRTQTADQFTNSAAGDYTLTSNSGSSKRAVDYGTVIPGITDGYTGSAPDAGAFESGVAPWTAGANWKAWTAPNQAAAPLAAALYVAQSGTRVTTGSLMVGNTTSTSANSRSFLRFDLSGIVATTIQSAVLRIYENTPPSSDTGSVTLNRVTSAWTNSTVTYGQSVDDVAPITGFYDPSNLDLYTDVNITSWVQGWLSNSSTNYGLRLCGSEDVAGTAKYFDGFYGVTAPQLVLTMPEAGDANLDGRVDVSDLAILAANYRKHVTGGWAQADFNNDGVVDVRDLAILAANYRYGVASDVVPPYDGLDAEAIDLLSLAGVTVAPEPGAVVLLATALIGVLAYAGWKRR